MTEAAATVGDGQKLTLMNDRILVRPDPSEGTYKNLIIIPDRHRDPSGTGTVVGIGPGMLCKDGTRFPMPDIQVGDHIVFSRDAKEVRRMVTIGGVEYMHLRDDDILAVLEE